jgi:tRNA(Ile)-lysidine synthase
VTADAQLVTRVHDWLDRNHPGSAPIALGYSGGGDSHALLCMAADWARRRGVVLHALIVDHALRPESLAEAERASRAAERLGATASLLSWTGDKPATGLQAAARQARHVLLAEACRARNIEHVLLAHTLDDQAETLWMRLQAGGGWRACAGMAGRVASPVWPQGRGIELLRPLLDVRRSALRAFLVAAGESWIDDPSNENPLYTRIRTRRKLGMLESAGFQPGRLCGIAADIGAIEQSERRAVAACGREAVRFHAWGGAQLDIERLALAAPVIRRRLVEALALAMSGRADIPRRAAIDGLVDSLLNRRPGSAAGVQTIHWRGGSWMFRDPGGVLGRVDRPGRKSVSLLQNCALVWDGRYEIETPSVNIIAEPLGKGYKGIGDRGDLESVPGPARPGLLALRCEGVVLAIAGVRHHPQLRVLPLMEQRYRTRLLCNVMMKKGGGLAALA